MKYGIMYYKDTDNIGDDIQTYAALKFLPHIDYYIDRESLNCFIPEKKECVSVIMNGWFMHNKSAWPPSPYINPLLISMHFTELDNIDVGDNYLKGLGGEYLRQYENIGCRDKQTQLRLNKNNIQNYFSGCLTLTINKFDDIKKQNYICVTDLRKDIVLKIKENTNKEVKVLTHKVEPKEISKKDFKERMNNVETLLKTYQAASLVITSRLHVALPCIALGTPVILLLDSNFEKDRLETYIKYLSSYSYEEFNSKNIYEILNTPIKHNNMYLEIKENLENKCIEFIRKCEQNDSIVELPDLDHYGEYVKKISWYKDLYEILMKNTMSTWLKCSEEKDRLIEENKELLKYKTKENEEILILIQTKKKNEEEIRELKEQLERIENSKGWKIYKKIRGIK